MSSYQKLKQEVRQLRQDIYKLIEKENEMPGIQVKMKYKLLFDIEKAIWSGSNENIRNNK